LLGCERIEELSPRHVNTRALERDIFDGEAGLEGAVLRSKL
jgi:L-lactate dehydrogenase (cytochrome)